MRAPTRLEFALVVVGLVVFGLWRASVGNAAAKEAALEVVRVEREDVRRENERLLRVKVETDKAAADTIAQLQGRIVDLEHDVDRAASTGRETYGKILDALVDSLPDLDDVRLLVEARERQHQMEVVSLRGIIDAERSASTVLLGQLASANTLIDGFSEDIQLANDQIALLESMRGKGFSNLELASLSTAAFFVSTKALSANTFEGLVVAGGTWVVLKGGSSLLGWIL